MNDESDNTVLNNRLMAIENILSSAAALNGGFDKLMVEIMQIKSNQAEVKELISKVAITVYDPSGGLVAKTRDVEAKIIEFDRFEESMEQVIDRHKEISLWVSARSKDLEKWDDKKGELLIEIDRLTQWKNNVTRLLWLMGGSTVGLLVKNFFSLMSSSQ